MGADLSEEGFAVLYAAFDATSMRLLSIGDKSTVTVNWFKYILLACLSMPCEACELLRKLNMWLSKEKAECVHSGPKHSTYKVICLKICMLIPQFCSPVK